MRYRLISLAVILVLIALLMLSNALNPVKPQPYPLAPHWQQGACIYFEQDDSACEGDQ